MVFDTLHGWHIPNGTVRPFLIVLSPPGFNHDLSLLQREKPVLVQTLIPKHASATLNKRVLDWLSRLNEVERAPTLTGPRVQGVPGEFRCVIPHQDFRHRPSGKDSIENAA